MVGKIFHDRYEILSVLGTGGTSIIYKGRDVLLNRLVTIKILREQYASDNDFVRRFRHEAQAVACLSHPNIVSIYDVVFDGDSHYLVMEYVEGCSLKDYMDQHGMLPFELSLKIIAQLLLALEHAHEHHVIHRDIKPHNILLDTNLNVKVTDFGIAVAVSDITQTYTKDVMGSVHYMSPEQVKGGVVKETSDIYSVGVVLYQLLTNVQPFDGENPIGVAMQHIQGELLPPHKLNSNISLEISYVIMKAMRKDPELRFSGALEMLEALKNARVAPADEELDEYDQEMLYDPSLATDYRNEDSEGVYDEESVRSYVPKKQAKNHKGKTATNPNGNKFFADGKPTKMGALAICLTIMAVIFIISIISIFSSILGENKEVEVPDVEGIALTEAMTTLNELKIQYSVTRTASVTVEKEFIISQNIPAGQKVKEGRYLELVVSDGAEMAKVPSVVGLTFREATVALTNRNLKVDTTEAVNNSVPAGSVISQKPLEDEEVPAGTVIELVISKGKTVAVPKLVGLTAEQAKAKLAESNLGLGGTSKKESTEFVADIVLSQSEEAGSKVLEGTEISLVVSDGPGPIASKARVTYTLPETEQEHTIKIVVVDTKGSHQEYEGKHFGGETIIQEVSFYGAGKIQVFLDGEAVFSQDVQ